MSFPSTGVLLVNLGTPDTPHPSDVYRYLVEFLTDERVIDNMAWWRRQLLVRGIIAPGRYRQTAQGYASIWTKEGSPLLLYGQAVRKLLQVKLGGDYVVELAMRYRNPSMEQQLEVLLSRNLKKLIILPLFPQYASATTGSVHQRAMTIIGRCTVIPEVVLVNSFPTQPKMIEAFCAISGKYKPEKYDHVLFSFHGLPQSQIFAADGGRHGCLERSGCCSHYSTSNRYCYKAQCYATARAIAKALELSPKCYTVSFQSRLGKTPWLEPYTNEVILQLANQAYKRVLVFSPSFVCDCLETLEEIATEYAHQFRQAGGTTLDLVPGLNDHPLWIDALAAIVKGTKGT